MVQSEFQQQRAEIVYVQCKKKFFQLVTM